MQNMGKVHKLAFNAHARGKPFVFNDTPLQQYKKRHQDGIVIIGLSLRLWTMHSLDHCIDLTTVQF